MFISRAAPDGDIWFTGGSTGLGKFSTTSDLVTLFNLPARNLRLMYFIAKGPDGNFWFTEWLSSNWYIGKVTPTGVVTEFSVSTATYFGLAPRIAAGPDGNVWFTEPGDYGMPGNKIGRITPDGTITEFTTPTANSMPSGITAGPDGNVWFTEPGVGKVARITTTACPADSHTLCLNNGRFSVTADFQQTPEGPSAAATAIPLTNDTGYFWFFDPANIELVVKVLTGCSVNNDYWVFAGGLTDVGVEMKVTDTVTGASKSYSNPFGTPFQPIQDSSAFPCP